MIKANPQQKIAIEHTSGALMIIAGAGSGKTHVITQRIAKLIHTEQVFPSEIIALTFTNKAAREMKERINTILECDTLPGMFVGTFHSYCLYLIRRNPHLVGEANFTILDTDDQLSIIKRICKEYSLEKRWTPSQILRLISHAKNNLSLKIEQDNVPGAINEIAQLYEREKSDAHCLDFDDLIVTIYNALSNNQEFAQSVRNRLKHVLIDEYQDTNTIQHELLKKLSLNKDNKLDVDSICAVGDEDQSIYSWRGAMVENMELFKKEFTPVTLVKIEQNYRSTPHILDAANNVIKNNKQRTNKSLWSDQTKGAKVLAMTCKNEYQEAEAAIWSAHNILRRSETSRVAVLYRTHAQSRVVEEALLGKRMAYKIVGGIRFYDRKEVKDILAYLKLIENPFDRTSLLRVINQPTRGLGDAFTKLMIETWEAQKLLPFTDLLSYMLTNGVWNGSAARTENLMHFIKMFQDLCNLNKTEPLFASDAIEIILEKSNYLGWLTSTLEPDDAQNRIDNINELRSASERFTQNPSSSSNPNEEITTPTLNNFLHEIALIQEVSASKDAQGDRLQLMTLHSAKGLEFDMVTLVGNEEGIFPGDSSIEDPKRLEEERRLFYVGMTRAKQHLLLTNTHTRNRYGRIRSFMPSRFLAELEMNSTVSFDATRSTHLELNRSIEEWIIRGTVVQTNTPLRRKTMMPKPQKSMPSRPRTRTVASSSTPSIKPATTATLGKETNEWKKNRTVSHPQFGPGVVVDVKKISTGDFCLTVSFKSGKRKILSKFLTML